MKCKYNQVFFGILIDIDEPFQIYALDNEYLSLLLPNLVCIFGSGCSSIVMCLIGIRIISDNVNYQDTYNTRLLEVSP